VEALDAERARNVLAVPDFRRLWLAGLAVSVARWLEMLVMAVVVFDATGSAFLVASMTLLRLAPMGLFGVLLGVMADRVPRRTALLGVLAMQAMAVGALALLALGGVLAVWHVAIACFIGGLGWAADNPVRRMLVGQSVGASRMVNAMSLDVVANNASRIAGPVLGGTLLALLGPGQAFSLSLLLYLLAIAAAFGIAGGRRAMGQTRGVPVLREMRESFGLARREPRLRGILVVTVVFNLFAWPCSSMVPVIGQASLGLGPKGIGVLASMDGLGALLGAMLIGTVVRPGWHAGAYVGGTALFLLMLLAFAAAPGPGWAAVALVAMGVGGAGFATMQATLTYLSVPPEQRGRALGVLSTAIGTGPIGFLQLGILAELIGAPAATALIAVQGLLALVLTFQKWNALFSAR
jgi:MFS family permease